MSILPKTGTTIQSLIAQNKNNTNTKNMNEIIIRSYDFKRWLRCQIAVKISASIWLIDSGRMVELIDLVPRYLEDTNSLKEWKKIHADLRGVGA
jgi:hypothetical protein